VAERLDTYRAKRDFSATAEPAGDREAPGADRRRFVIQEHSATRLHWDLRLERDGVLASWAIPNGIPEEPKTNRLAVRTEDHPLEYLEFEGVIPKGSYGAGTMKIWDQGTYECLKWEPRKVEVALHGERLDARYALFAIGEGDPPKDWMIHRMDPPADPEAQPMPDRIVPMLARLGGLPHPDGNWAFEIKWDGVRAIAYSEPGRLRFESRNLHDITGRYPELARLNRALSSHRAVLDGEIVAFDEAGHPSFEALQRRMHLGSEVQARRLAREAPVTYVIFDLLWLDGRSLMALAYEERRARLAELNLNGERWQAPDHVVGRGKEVLAASAAQGLEGVVAKRLDSVYEPGRRSHGWVKVKNVTRQELVIGGWVPGEGRRRERIGALLLGVREDGILRYVGKVGTGFTESELERLSALLAPLERDTSPFAAGPKLPREAIFVEPQLVAEVEFREWTREGMLRASSYKGLRDDKPAELVVREENLKTAWVDVGGREVKLSNPTKVLYPATGFSKRDLVEYYVGIAPAILPHLEDRPLTLKRYPDGVEGKHFFEKQSPSHRPDWVQTVSVPSERRQRIDFTLAQDLPTLVWLANLAVLELHTQLHRAQALDRPTMLVFDLDPGPPATIVECCRVALWLQGMFEGLRMQSFAKTSGSKGLQVYVPLNTEDVTYDDTKSFAKTVAELLEQEEPELVVSRMTKSLREGKVLVDWSQNDRHKTTVCAYSLRAREKPTVSTPVEWDEVAATARSEDPGQLVFEYRQVLERVADRGDLFAPAVSLVQQLPKL
jgi:bifunctional non-homologous end joining protein LigD